MIKDKKFLVIGAARSGIAAVEYLIIHNAQRVILCDDKPIEKCIPDEVKLNEFINNKKIELYFSKSMDIAKVQDVDMVILSPSVPPSNKFVQYAKQLSIPVMTEFEFAYLFAKCDVIAITGTNGKTTTTTLMGEICRDAGLDTRVVGNIGYPFISNADELGKDGVFVAEISSYQLELCSIFKPKVAIITNITPDHLDRHGSFEEYVRVKYKITMNQDSLDTLIVNADEPYSKAAVKYAKCRCLEISCEGKVDNGAYYNKEDDGLYIADNGREIFLLKKDEMKVPGLHNVANALCAAAAAYAYNIDPKIIANTIKNFGGVEHRIEYVATKYGVDYINDSKGTNTDATTIALKAMSKPTVLILGGYDKGSEFDDLIQYIKQHVVHIVVLGQTKQKIIEMLDKYNYYSYFSADTFKDAVMMCKKLARPGDCVLLSPSCASWDMFSSFEERGELFKKLVKEEV
ncbi:MAG: UDP-N-acetylmuramoyl-L-alanine--D-glutamate ligase [Eubacteriaceae bacterium]|nr:UDP-N-acetylmuramoyl-L-alanine--D-glutamate ligase [Eubacteriaceae bacterium]